MAKRKQTESESPADENAVTLREKAPLADIAAIAEEQRADAPEETPDDIARKALGGATDEPADIVSTSTETKITQSPATGGITDKSGAVFDPTKHAVKSDGSPAFAKSGYFRAKRGTGPRVRIPNSGVASGLTTDEQQRAAAAASAAAEEQKRRKAMIAANGITEIIFKSGYMLGGDEWLPIKHEEKQIDERRDMQTAWAELCYAKDMSDIPPGLLVAFVCSAYALPRFTAPETKKRLSAFAIGVQKASLWFKNWRLNRKRRKEEKNAARATNGNDGERKNNAREGDSARTG
jgi:hypothetical protein